MYILRKYKNNVYVLENVDSYDNITNYIILNIKNNISKLIVLKVIAYNINMLNNSSKKIMVKINDIGNIILVNMDYLEFVKFFTKIKI